MSNPEKQKRDSDKRKDADTADMRNRVTPDMDAPMKIEDNPDPQPK